MATKITAPTAMTGRGTGSTHNTPSTTFVDGTAWVDSDDPDHPDVAYYSKRDAYTVETNAGTIPTAYTDTVAAILGSGVGGHIGPVVEGWTR